LACGPAAGCFEGFLRIVVVVVVVVDMVGLVAKAP
jgi:hypothetical protein